MDAWWERRSGAHSSFQHLGTHLEAEVVALCSEEVEAGAAGKQM